MKYSFNPRQKEYPNHLGFNDLHIQAIRHLRPEGNSEAELSKFDIIVHHHCKAYDDGAFTCLMFHSGMKDYNKPIGFEYVITAAQYAKLPKEEKKYWHYYKTDPSLAKATLPDLTANENAKLLPAISATYGMVVYFWKWVTNIRSASPSSSKSMSSRKDNPEAVERKTGQKCRPIIMLVSIFCLTHYPYLSAVDRCCLNVVSWLNKYVEGKQ